MTSSKLLFALFALCSTLFAVRMPIDMMEPSAIGSLAGLAVPMTTKLYAYHDETKYCVHYPDIMCYRRDGNGWSPGDSGLWLLSSVTDYSGLGSIRVRFPPATDELDLDGTPHNGWYHPLCSHPVSGVTVHLTSFSPDVRIGPDGQLTYSEAVPMARWAQDLYVEYSGFPNVRHFFAMRRTSIFTDQAPPPYHRHPPPWEAGGEDGGGYDHPDLLLQRAGGAL